jgi:tetratricopeptide (TPR) repeat protein
MEGTWGGIPSDRVVAVVADLDTGLVQIGSGYLVAERRVLTALHCTVDKSTGRQPRSLRVVRRSDGAEAPATPIAAASDVAVLTVGEGPAWAWATALEPPTFGRVDRDRAGELRDCEAVGFPLWQFDPQDQQRNAAELHGTIRVTEDVESGLLVMRDPLLSDVAAPGAATAEDRADGSPWGGLSGALVFHQGIGLGVVIEHHPRQGRSAITIMPVERFAAAPADGDLDSVPVATALGLPPADKLPLVEARPLPGLVDRRRGVPREFPQAAALVGRAAELEEVYDVLCGADTRTPAIVAITGMAGVGKTTLAVNVAQDLAKRFPDGALYVDLRGTQERPLSADLIVRRFLRALEIDDSRIPADLDEQVRLYRTVTASRRVIIILDNAASESQVRRLLPSNGSAAIITSRSSLGALETARPLTLSPLSEDAACMLLLRSSERHAAEVDMSPLRNIVRLCGNLPLAVTIAGRRLALKSHWSVEYFASRLADQRKRLSELEVGDMSVRAAFSLSYEAQPEELKNAFVRLAALNWPSFTVYPAAATLSATPDEASDFLEQLVDAGLLNAVTTAGSFWQIRYRFHDLMHEFATELISPPALQASVEVAGLAYSKMGSLAYERFEAGRPRVQVGEVDPGIPVPDEAFANGIDTWYEAERETLTALIWQAHALGLRRVVVYLANALPTMLIIRGQWNDWERLYRLAVEDAAEVDDVIGEAYSLQNLANVVRTRGDFRESAEYIRRSLDLFRSADDRTGEAYLLIDDGLAAMFLGDIGRARSSFASSIDLFHSVGNDLWEAHAQRCLGILETQRGYPEHAIGPLRAAAQVFRDVGEYRWADFTAADLGDALGKAGQFDEAVDRLREARAAVAAHGEIRWSAVAGLSLADIYVERGLLDEAGDVLRPSLATFADLRDSSWTAKAHLIEGEMEAHRGNWDSAQRLIRDALEVFRGGGDRSTEAEALLRLSRIQARSGDVAGAVESWESARLLLPAEHRVITEGRVPWLE